MPSYKIERFEGVEKIKEESKSPAKTPKFSEVSPKKDCK